MQVSSEGTHRWYLNDELHREDGPAVIYPNGCQEWFFHNKLHRKDGPAVIWSNGYQEWYLNGRLHRKDGPAIISHNGEKYWWYLHGVRVSPEEVFNRMTKEQKMKAAFNLDEWK